MNPKQKITALTISLDLQILKPDYSTAQERHLEYAKAFDQLLVIVLSSKSEHSLTQSQTHFYQDSLQVFATNSWWKPLAILDALRLAINLNKQHKIQVLSAQDPLATGITAWLISRLLHIPWNLQLHSTFFLTSFHQPRSLAQKLTQQFVLWLIKQADTIRVVNQEVKQTLIEQHGVSKSKLSWIPLSQDIGYFYHPVKPKKKIRHLLNVGRLVPVKNQLLLIRAMAEVVKKQPDMRLHIVGDGELRQELADEINRLGLVQSVALVGSMDRAGLKKELQQADVFISTSQFEGFGLAIAEAVAAGIPVLSTNVGVVKDVLAEQNAVTVLGKLKTETISKQILDAISEPKKIYQQALKAQELILSIHNQPKLTQELMSLLYQTAKTPYEH